MATKTSIIIKSTDENGKETSRSITNVSNTATNSQLQAFAEALNNTSINDYQSSSKVQTTDLDDATEKTARTVNILQGTSPASTITSAVDINSIGRFDLDGEKNTFCLEYTGDDAPLSTTTPANTPSTIIIGAPVKNTLGNVTGGYFTIGIYDADTISLASNVEVTVSIAETANYQAAQAVITLTGGNS